MQETRRFALPLWLTTMLAVAFVISGLTVAILVLLTVREVANRPLNPFGGSDENPVAVAAQEVADISLDPLDQNGVVPPPLINESVVGEPTPSPIPTSMPAG